MIDPALFAAAALEELRKRLANSRRKYGWSVQQLIDRLAQVGVRVVLESSGAARSVRSVKRKIMATAAKLGKLPDAPVMPARLLTAEQVAEYTGLSVETLAQWRSQRRGIPFLKLSRNVVRYRPADLDKFVNERMVRVEQDTPLAGGRT